MSGWVSGGVTITREMVVDKVHALFGPADREAVLGVLDEGDDSPRVQMAILKLAGGSVDEVLKRVLEARTDYRDVLGAAEYPRGMRTSLAMRKVLPQSEHDRISRMDRDEYLAWLGVTPPDDGAAS